MLSLSNAGAEGEPPSAIRLRALSLGARVHSTTLALMAADGAVGPITLTIDRDDSPRPTEHLCHLSGHITRCQSRTPATAAQACERYVTFG